MFPPSPRSHPTVRKIRSGALTITVVALPAKGATNTTLLHTLPHSSTAGKRPVFIAQPTPWVRVLGKGTLSCLEA